MSETPRFHRSFETQKILDLLVKIPSGEVITYKAMTEACGAEINGYSYAARSARALAEKETGFIFSPVTGVGLKRLTDDEIVQNSHADRSRLRNIAKRALVKLTAVQNFHGLPEDLKRTHQAHATILAVVADVASAETANRLQTTQTNSRELLSNIISTKA